ncbi:uncharacterized protein N7459_007635 [Penicillium hispanicum]|uniref:uncharacterized protein n=1 Tax=Penicillium hispanicum TaxID=1080232 RepID=UPI0025424EF0|nr:uncharacterized protein N7459_007635 [Penicillium hispanicum]KAJ5578671.1 hypothetical protein N7459_007635 [Penicillium hispanicum]
MVAVICPVASSAGLVVEEEVEEGVAEDDVLGALVMVMGSQKAKVGYEIEPRYCSIDLIEKATQKEKA